MKYIDKCDNCIHKYVCDKNNCMIKYSEYKIDFNFKNIKNKKCYECEFKDECSHNKICAFVESLPPLNGIKDKYFYDSLKKDKEVKNNARSNKYKR